MSLRDENFLISQFLVLLNPFIIPPASILISPTLVDRRLECGHAWLWNFMSSWVEIIAELHSFIVSAACCSSSIIMYPTAGNLLSFSSQNPVSIPAGFSKLSIFRENVSGRWDSTRKSSAWKCFNCQYWLFVSAQREEIIVCQNLSLHRFCESSVTLIVTCDVACIVFLYCFASR